MPDQISTSLRWNLATAVIVTATMAGAAWWLIAHIDAYEAAAARATESVTAQVVRSENAAKGDDPVTVAWRDAAGHRHEVGFLVDDSRAFQVGDDFPLKAQPGSAEVYPISERVATPASDAGIGITLLALLVWLPIWHGARLAGYWRASRRPPEPVSMRLWRGEPTRATIGTSRIVWVELVDATGGRWYQRVMWEPWLAGMTAKVSKVMAQRTSRRRPALVTTASGGRLYWAGRARRRQPGLIEVLLPGPPRPGGNRWSLVLAMLLAAVFPAVIAGAVAGLVVFAAVLDLVILNGAPPFAPAPPGRGVRKGPFYRRKR
jgi:hypothetical protein